MLVFTSPPLRTTLRSLFGIAFLRLNLPLKCTFTCTSPWLRSISRQDGAKSLTKPTEQNISRFWTPEETDTLKRVHGQGMKPNEMLPHLPHRNLASIKSKINVLFGKSSRGWLPKEWERLVVSLKAGASAATIQAQLPHRTLTAINGAIRRFRAGTSGSRYVQWTDDERHQLMSLRGYHTLHEIRAAHLPHRTVLAMKKELVRLVARSPEVSDIRLRTPRPWLQNEVDKLRDLHSQGLTKKEICRMLNRNPGALSGKSAGLGLKLKHSQRQKSNPWTDKEDAILLPMITQPMSRYGLENLFPYRSHESVARRVAVLRKREGLTRPQKPWTQDQETELRHLISLGSTISEISQKLDRGYTTIRYKMARLSKP